MFAYYVTTLRQALKWVQKPVCGLCSISTSLAMSAPVSPRASAKATAPSTGDGDHRKRRRNRTTQSCLNCHTTKRMCDRKRPCTRCSQLGISANCVYEVDDPGRLGKPDESGRLMNRITELEGVIRELKNNKSPSHQDRSPRPSGVLSHSPSPPHSGVGLPSNNTGGSSPSSGGHSPGPNLHLPAGFGDSQSVPSYLRPDDPLSSLMAAYAGLTDHMFVRRGGNCNCLNEAACYQVVLELSLRLRKTADVLARSPSHSSHPSCALNSRISELDTFAKNSLLDVPNYDTPLSPSFNRGPSNCSGKTNPRSPPNIFDQQYAGNGGVSLEYGHSDNFMSWMPAHGNM
ncbi:hypothetical protein C8F04DRAFT_715195 [Mycena alexandri]|uniref:Zn(2)-C6 fungal-type domain-containing protein n=1 Tax=Mycena alexandri TaxID=1745969 RepID=A0AAD6SMU9_9AGAR|nr:hypothetical protein C8F04DRAFT_715195 [Mycena alexandri]